MLVATDADSLSPQRSDGHYASVMTIRRDTPVSFLMSASHAAPTARFGVRATGPLVSRLRAGDAEALAELFDNAAPLALGLAVRLVNDRVRAEDLVHEAFVTVWREIHGYQGTDVALPHWLLGLVHASAAQSAPFGSHHVSRDSLTVSSPTRVAVIDDDPEFLELMHDVLEGERYVAALIPGGHGGDVLTAIRRSRADILIVHLGLGGDAPDGWTIAEAVRRDPDIGGLPILFHSADAARFAAAGQELHSLPSCGLLRKPFALGDLYASVERLLEAAASTSRAPTPPLQFGATT
jgi:CheY-like chemotaxis protein